MKCKKLLTEQLSWNDPSDTHAAKFKALTEQFNLTQHVSIPTHDARNTLDLVLTRDDFSVSSIFIDHSVQPHCCTFHYFLCIPWCCQKVYHLSEMKIICASWYNGRIRGFCISEYRHCRPDLQFNSNRYHRQSCTKEVTNRYSESW